jgi:hypothetical protein
MTFTQVFGGTTIYPSGVSYRAVALSASQTLAWPVETATSANVVAQIMDIAPSVGSLSITMPPANEVSVGETTLFFNAGSFAFTVKDNGGNTIVSIAAGLSYQVYLIGNSTVNGTWRSTQYSAGTSSATAGSLVGAGIKAISTSLNQSMSVTSLNSNYIIGNDDRSEAFVWTGGAGTLTLPSATAVGNDWFCHVRNSGTGAIALNPVGSDQINGAVTLAFNPGDSAIVICDGTNFFTIGFGQSASFAFDYVSIDLTSQTSPYTLSGANLNRIAYSFGGALTANMVVEIPATFQQYWISNDTTGGYSITVKVAGQTGVTIVAGARAICYCNGTDLIDADTASISFPLTVAQGGTGATTESGARINLGGTSTGIAVFIAASAAAGRTALSAAASGANSDITSLTGLTTPLSAPQGGTGQSSYAVGDIVYASTTTALSKLADVATGNALISGGVGVAPSYGKIGLTTHVSGTLPVASGGTGATTLTGALIGNGTGAFTAVAPGTAGNLLTSDGTNWASTAPTSVNQFVLVSTANPSAASEVVFTGLTSTYSHYIIVIELASTNAVLRCQLSVDNGSTYAASFYYSNLVTISNGSVTCAAASGAGQTYIDLGTGGSGYLKFTSPGNTGATETDYGQTLYSEVNGITTTKYIGMGRYIYAANAIRIFPAAGTITGTIKLYGVKA